VEGARVKEGSRVKAPGQRKATEWWNATGQRKATEWWKAAGLWKIPGCWKATGDVAG